MTTAPTTTQQSDALAKTKAQLPTDLKGWINYMGPQIARALPKHISAERMARVMLTALTTTPDLERCTTGSFMGCVLQASQLGLEVNTPLGHAYLIPRRDKNLKPDERRCTLIVGYQGYIELARRSGKVSNIFATTVHHGDAFSYTLGLDPTLVHTPSEDPKRSEKAVTHAYCVASMADSKEKVFVVLTRGEIDARMKRGDSANSSYSPWKTDFPAMAVKSAVRAIWKWLPKSSEMVSVDRYESALEAQRPQLAGFDPGVTQMLAEHNVPQDAIDADTGEVIEDSSAAADLNDPAKRAALGLPDRTTNAIDQAALEAERAAADKRGEEVAKNAPKQGKLSGT